MKVAVVILADIEDEADQARMVNAMGTVQECLEAGDDVRVLFDGAGTQWPLLLQGRAHPMSDVWEKVRDQATVCSRCASQFDVGEDALRGGAGFSEGSGHLSIREIMEDGFRVLSF